jgi:hypothetical protein
MSMPPPSQFNTHANLFASESCLIKHGGNGAKQNYTPEANWFDKFHYSVALHRYHREDQSDQQTR